MASNSLNTPYIALAGAIIIGVAAIFAVFQPALSRISTLRSDLQAKQITLTEREAFLRTLDQQIATLAGQAQHEQQLNVILPVQHAPEDILRIVHQAEINSGGLVRGLTDISPGLQSTLNAQRARGDTTNLPAAITPLGVEIEFRGSYQQLRVLLETLQRSPRLIDITSLEIRRNQQQIDAIGATFRAQFYRYNENQ